MEEAALARRAGMGVVGAMTSGGEVEVISIEAAAQTCEGAVGDVPITATMRKPAGREFAFESFVAVAAMGGAR